MLCEKCGKNIATTHIRSVVNGVAKEKHLCAHCAAKEGIGGVSDSGLSSMLASMFGDALTLKPSSAQVRCKCCGSTFSDIAENGKAGCPECYTTFYDEFLPYIKRVHGAVKHIGKIPQSKPDVQKESAETVDSLKIKLAELVREEKFEQAAEIRDKIREMEESQK